VAGKHYHKNSIAAPVAIVMMLLLMASWYGEFLDVKRAFLRGEFEEGKTLYIKVPEGFRKYYPIGYVLLLLKTIYRLKQAGGSRFLEAGDYGICKHDIYKKSGPSLSLFFLKRKRIPPSNL
jgi:hypothetical protein